MRRLSLAIIAGGLMTFLAASAHAGPALTVIATSSIYFAGHSDAELATIVAGSIYDSGDYFGDLADATTRPGFVNVTGLGPLLDISASGMWTHGPCCTETGPVGKGVAETTMDQYGIFGISLLTADLNMLIGVFLDDSAPVPGAEPAALSTEDGDDMRSPLLAQAFAIGAGLDNIMVPTGATRLFLGMHDGYEWTNNSGRVAVRVEPASVPEPRTVAILGLGLVGVAFFRRRKQH